MCLLDNSGTANIKELLQQANRVVNEVGIKHNLPLQPDKHEEMCLQPGRDKGSGKRKKRIEIERVKWLDIIIDETLDFDHHWKSRIDKARKLLGALSSIGLSQ